MIFSISFSILHIQSQIFTNFLTNSLRLNFFQCAILNYFSSNDFSLLSGLNAPPWYQSEESISKENSHEVLQNRIESVFLIGYNLVQS